ncbi:DUF6999 family protein [Luedemannella helvata]|uniref:Uncharacterized protein n=1 Tax=Luedemannella helvata TaxID=349315 RepID=A0ABP4WJB5_9ACTN
MSDPSVWAAILADPGGPIDAPTLRLVVRDQQRWSRRWLYPWVRVVSRATVFLIRVGKAFVPGVRAHRTMDALCVWFLRRFVSPEAGELLIRHFLVETNLLNVALRTAGLAPVTLRPASLRDLGNRAVIEHDINVYDVIVALRGRSWAGPLDLSGLDIEPIDAEPGRRRWLNLDIQTALCLMNIPFAACLTRDEYRRAVHSLRLDAQLLGLLADVTGDDTFHRWRPAGVPVRVDSGLDVPRAVYEHAVICEYAHGHLRALAVRRIGVAVICPV